MAEPPRGRRRPRVQAQVRRILSDHFELAPHPTYENNFYATGKKGRRPWRIELAVFTDLGMDEFEAVHRRPDDPLVNETWVIGLNLSDDIEIWREAEGNFPEFRVYSVDELPGVLIEYKKLKKLPAATVAEPLRSRVARTVLANANELRAAATTSIVLIEERLESLSHSRPNAEESKARNADEIKRLTAIRTQLQVLRDYPELLRKREVKEVEVERAVYSLSYGISDYWKNHADTICDKMLTFGLFSSLVLVGQLSGVMPEIAFGLAGAMTYGKPVVDALKAMKGWFKAS